MVQSAEKRQRRYGRHRTGYDRQHRQIPETNTGQLSDLALHRRQQSQLHESPRQQRRRIAFHCRRSAEMRLQTNHHRRSQRKKPDRRREFGQNQM